MEDEHELDITEEEAIADLKEALFPDRADLYNGPGAYSIRKLMKLLHIDDRDQIIRRANRAVKKGVMVKVNIRETIKHRTYTVQAWVFKRDYDKWVAKKK